jgi:hypothetical protein
MSAMTLTRNAKAALYAGVGRTLPMDTAAILKGYYEPNNPASCFICGLMGPCQHDVEVEDTDNPVFAETVKRVKRSRCNFPDIPVIKADEPLPAGIYEMIRGVNNG